jgi:hypothetical protein
VAFSAYGDRVDERPVPGPDDAADQLTVPGRWTYVWGARRRPFLHPVRTPAGVVVTRDAPDDHPWHHGLWFTIKYVNGDNYWEEYDAYGVLRHDGPPTVTVDGGRVALSGLVRWIAPDRSTVVIEEQRALTHVPLGDDGYAIDLDTTLVASADSVLDRTPFTTWGGYSGFTLRGAAEWHDTRLRLPDGTEHDRLLGVPSPWCELVGPVGPGGPDGTVAGVVLVDHPANPRAPVPWYGSTRADTYGQGWANFLNAAFLWDEPLAVTGGEAVRFRYRAVVHDGSWPLARIHEVARAFRGAA